MADPLRDATAGQGSPFVTNLGTVNGVLAAARDWRDRRMGNVTGEPVRDNRLSATYCRVRNDTGGNLNALEVVALGDPVISAVDFPHSVNRTPVFAGTAPAAATDAFAVLVEPVAYNQIGLAAVVGLAVVDLDVTDEAHDYAAPAAGVTLTLASATSGPARVLWKETGTGTKRAVVLIGQAAGGSGSAGFFARLTTSSSGKWKWVALTLDSGGAWQDDGSESATFNAVPSTVDGTNLANPAAGLRVWMVPSAQAGYYEFLPVGYAASGLPGLVSIASQTFSGEKTFEEPIHVNAAESARPFPPSGTVVYPIFDVLGGTYAPLDPLTVLSMEEVVGHTGLADNNQVYFGKEMYLEATSGGANTPSQYHYFGGPVWVRCLSGGPGIPSVRGWGFTVRAGLLSDLNTVLLQPDPFEDTFDPSVWQAHYATVTISNLIDGGYSVGSGGKYTKLYKRLLLKNFGGSSGAYELYDVSVADGTTGGQVRIGAAGYSIVGTGAGFGTVPIDGITDTLEDGTVVIGGIVTTKGAGVTTVDGGAP